MLWTNTFTCAHTLHHDISKSTLKMPAVCHILVIHTCRELRQEEEGIKN